jgi:hypothetical protein
MAQLARHPNRRTLMPAHRRDHYKGNYQTEAARVRAAANANPLTRCARCNRTLAEHPPTRTGKPPRWDAGHKWDGQPGSPLQPEVAGCNRSAGAVLGNTRRQGITTTRNW